ncbi:glycosyltransferase family 4 protein [Novosphingobium sp. B1]|uniref:glycosyltransferase family 4 protein n=1 Tax=Novosphingobium sp. B1 TaxID=1938756 RepID=UPI0009D7E252|nr:glycosyltransferase family 4 protein [Novosphingobium sp. B1]SMD09055.1 Glycosyltransferase involved in cell wall bisynthesis [Novosphingobium sp. B1]
MGKFSWTKLQGIFGQFQHRRVDISTDEEAFLRSIFCAQYYARVSGKATLSEDQLFADFLKSGLGLDFSPTPLFDKEIFLRQIVAGTDNTPAILKWYRSPHNRRLIASQFFDAEYYNDVYRDVATSEVSGYEHYLCYGEQERRQPNALFDPFWYDLIADRSPAESQMTPHAHFITFGIERGAAPCASLLSVFARTSTARLKPMETYGRVVRATAPWFRKIGQNQTHLALQLFHPEHYEAAGSLISTASGLERLEHYLELGLIAGYNPSPLFDSVLYQERLGLEATTSDNPLLHFLENGPNNRIVPTNLFDPDDYLSAWPDIAAANLWGFGHFVAHGIFEGRRIDGSERVGHWALPADSAGGQLHNWELFWAEAASNGDTPNLAAPTEVSALARVEPQHLPLLKALFCAPYYAQKMNLSPQTPEDRLFQDYLDRGLNLNVPPGPLFDPAMAKALVGASEEPVIIAWLNKRQPHWRAPTSFFDKKYYLSIYEREFQGMALDLFEHFVLHGVHENRQPCAIFDPNWYLGAYPREVGEESLPAYLHYLVYGLQRGNAPCQLLLATYALNGSDKSSRLEQFVAINQSVSRWLAKLDGHKVQVLLAMFSPYFYDGDGRLAKRSSGAERLIDFLDRGLEAGIAPSPLFDPSCYEVSGLSSDVPFLHYLRHGWNKKIVPTKIYCEASYQNAHWDIQQHKIWGFKHFLFHGIYEGRKVDESAKLTIFVDTTIQSDLQLSNVRLFWAANGAPLALLGLPSRIANRQIRLNEILKSKSYAKSVRRALELDPSIGDIKKGQGYHAPPSHEPAYPAIQKLYDRVPNKKYETIVLVPWLRTGGADLVACQISSACKRAASGGNVLLLLVDQPNLERPDWISEGVDVAHVSDILQSLPAQTAERLLFVLFKSLAPKRIINVNSFRGWKTLERFGKRLRPHMDLYAYMFCWDQTKDGFRVGYPSLFFASTAPVLSALFTDTEYLRNELMRIYSPPKAIADRVRPLYTPSRTLAPKKSFAAMSFEQRSARRPRIIWAGRLDMQKRFDMVQLVAQKMPDVDFLCWGDAVLDTPPDQSSSPRNLILRPGFKSYEELPLQDADLWLFTSAWEGMPTILIEIAVRGMSVVASAVGGVPELIDESTGYPVTDAESVDAYVSAIRTALADPTERIARANRLMDKAAQRFSEMQYDSALRTIFSKEDQ